MCARANALMTKRSAPDHLGRAASFAGAPNRAKHRRGAARIGDQCGEPRRARLDLAGPLQPLQCWAIDPSGNREEWLRCNTRRKSRSGLAKFCGGVIVDV